MTSNERDRLSGLGNDVSESGRMLVIELDDQGCLCDANQVFRSRFAGFQAIHGKPIGHFFTSGDGACLSVEPGLAQRLPVPYIAKDIHSGETYLFQAYSLGRGTLLIGELAKAEANDGIERMGQLAIELSRLMRDLRETNHELALANARNKALAHTDSLTGIANRRYFMDRLRTSIEHAQARRHGLSLVMIDLDRFQRVNDRFGRAGGDSVLIAVAALLLSQVRSADLAARYGGEAFVLYMLDADLQSATEAAERIRGQISQLRPVDAEFVLTASFGVTTLSQDDHADSLLKRADHLLYRAKTEGGDRVIAGVAARRPAAS